MSEAIELAKKYGATNKWMKHADQYVILSVGIEEFYAAVLELGIQRGRELEQKQYSISGWLRGHKFIGLPEQAKPTDVPLYAKRVL